MSALPAALTDAERAELAQIEDRIAGRNKGNDEDLAVISDKRLYREDYATFESYCLERWGFTASRARQLRASGRVKHNLESVTNVTPINEGQTRPLMALKPDEQRTAWAEAVDRSGGKPTGAIVAEVVKEMRTPTPIRPVETWAPEDEEGGDTQEEATP